MLAAGDLKNCGYFEFFPGILSMRGVMIGKLEGPMAL